MSKTLWSRLILAHMEVLKSSSSREVLDFMLAESGLIKDKSGEIQVEGFGGLYRYLDTLESYLGMLYRQRAENIFEEFIEQAASQGGSGSDADATGIQRGVGAAVDHESPCIGPGDEITVRPHSGKPLEVRGTEA